MNARHQAEVARDRRADRHGRRRRHRPLHLHADPAADGGRPAPHQGRGRPHRLGQFSGISRRRRGCGLAAALHQPARLALGCAGDQCRDNRRHGMGVWPDGISRIALPGRGGERVRARVRIGPRPGAPGGCRSRKPLGPAFFRRRYRHCRISAADLGTDGRGRRLARHVARWRRSLGGCAPRGDGALFRAPRPRGPRRPRQPRKEAIRACDGWLSPTACSASAT